jgi:hypothetical protein
LLLLLLLVLLDVLGALVLLTAAAAGLACLAARTAMHLQVLAVDVAVLNPYVLPANLPCAAVALVCGGG